MIKSHSVVNSTEKAVKSFDNIKKSLKGLMDILRINSPTDGDIYYQLGKDNIIVLYHNLIDLILNEDGIGQLRRKLKESEVKFNAPSSDFLQNNK